MKMNERIIAWYRKERDKCEKGTVGCSIDHTAELLREMNKPKSQRNPNEYCETW